MSGVVRPWLSSGPESGLSGHLRPFSKTPAQQYRPKIHPKSRSWPLGDSVVMHIQLWSSKVPGGHSPFIAPGPLSNVDYMALEGTAEPLTFLSRPLPRLHSGFPWAAALPSGYAGYVVRFQPPGAKPGFAPRCELGDLADLNGPSARRDSADFWFPTHLPKDLESGMLCAWSSLQEPHSAGAAEEQRKRS